MNYDIIVKKQVSKFINSQKNSITLWNKIYMLKYFKSEVKLNIDIEKYEGKSDWIRLRIGDIRFLFGIYENTITIFKANYRNRIYK